MRSSQRGTLPRRGDNEETTHRTCRGPASAACNAPAGRARIVLIDDDWIMLSRLREIIAQSSDLVVVAACRCADGTMLAGQQHLPGLVLPEVDLPRRGRGGC